MIYITTPVQNLNYTILKNEKPLYYPYYSTQALFPTIIRNKVFNETKDYGNLLSEAYNTTGMYVPLIRDFGKIISIIIVIFLQILVSIIHVKSKHKNPLSYKLAYPPLFMCIILSPFNLFYFIDCGFLSYNYSFIYSS